MRGDQIVVSTTLRPSVFTLPGKPQESFTMVFHLVALGAMVLVGKALQEGANSYERKKARDRAAIANMASTPKGYLPQSDLLFDFPLEDGEELIATFEFVASKWMKDLYSSNKMFPSLLGSRLGIGHVTNKRILLFYDLKRIHGSGKWTGQSVKNAGKVSSKFSVFSLTLQEVSCQFTFLIARMC